MSSSAVGASTKPATAMSSSGTTSRGYDSVDPDGQVVLFAGVRLLTQATYRELAGRNVQ